MYLSGQLDQTTLMHTSFHTLHKTTYLVRKHLGRLMGIRINGLVLCEELKQWFPNFFLSRRILEKTEIIWRTSNI